jgi:thioredoxin 1
VAEGIRSIDRRLIRVQEGKTRMALQEVTDDNFDAEVLAGSGPVWVDFWAEWCGSCKQMMPAFEQLAGEVEGKAKLVKFNADENPMTPGRFGVRGLPTIMIFENGKLIATKTGAMTKSKLADWLKETAPSIA